MVAVTRADADNVNGLATEIVDRLISSRKLDPRMRELAIPYMNTELDRACRRYARRVGRNLDFGLHMHAMLQSIGLNVVS